MNVNNKIQKGLGNLSIDIRNKYNLNDLMGYLEIDNNGLYINVNYDHSFHVDENEFTFHIRNEKMTVTLFKSIYLVHITVY